MIDKPKLDFVALAMLFYFKKLFVTVVIGKRYETQVED
jgi:hypothetical protein